MVCGGGGVGGRPNSERFGSRTENLDRESVLAVKVSCPTCKSEFELDGINTSPCPFCQSPCRNDSGGLSPILSDTRFIPFSVSAKEVEQAFLKDVSESPDAPHAILLNIVLINAERVFVPVHAISGTYSAKWKGQVGFERQVRYEVDEVVSLRKPVEKIDTSYRPSPAWTDQGGPPKNLQYVSSTTEYREEEHLQRVEKSRIEYDWHPEQGQVQRRFFERRQACPESMLGEGYLGWKILTSIEGSQRVFADWTSGARVVQNELSPEQTFELLKGSIDSTIETACEEDMGGEQQRGLRFDSSVKHETTLVYVPMWRIQFSYRGEEFVHLYAGNDISQSWGTRPVDSTPEAFSEECNRQRRNASAQIKRAEKLFLLSGFLTILSIGVVCFIRGRLEPEVLALTILTSLSTFILVGLISGVSYMSARSRAKNVDTRFGIVERFRQMLKKELLELYLSGNASLRRSTGNVTDDAKLREVLICSQCRHLTPCAPEHDGSSGVCNVCGAALDMSQLQTEEILAEVPTPRIFRVLHGIAYFVMILSVALVSVVSWPEDDESSGQIAPKVELDRDYRVERLIYATRTPQELGDLVEQSSGSIETAGKVWYDALQAGKAIALNAGTVFRVTSMPRNRSQSDLCEITILRPDEQTAKEYAMWMQRGQGLVAYTQRAWVETNATAGIALE